MHCLYQGLHTTHQHHHIFGGTSRPASGINTLKGHIRGIIFAPTHKFLERGDVTALEIKLKG
jgi:hypothetical protein